MDTIKPILECAQIRYEAHSFPWHVHPNFYTFSIVLGGEADLIFRGQYLRVKKGQAYFIPPNLPHKTIIPHYLEYTVLRISDQVLHNLAQLTSKSYLLFDLHSTKILAEEMYKIQASPDFYADFDRLEYLVLNNAKPSFIQNSGFRLSSSTQKVVDYIRENYIQKLSLRELSEIAELSSSHFHRLFCQELGISPNPFIQSIRVDKAKELIQLGHSLTEVAHEVGYYDQSHFNKYFKNFSGLIPKAYARQVQNE